MYISRRASVEAPRSALALSLPRRSIFRRAIFSAEYYGRKIRLSRIDERIAEHDDLPEPLGVSGRRDRDGYASSSE
jgi:hypothetical protein